MRARDRNLIPIFAALGLAVALPLSLSPVAALSDPSESKFYIKAENLSDSSIVATSGGEFSGAPVDQSPSVPAPSPETPSPTPTITPTPTLTPTPDPTTPALPAPEVPVEAVKPVFVAGPGNYELKTVKWEQMNPRQTCADVSVRGTGGLAKDWYLTMDASTVPFNSDFTPGNYQFPVWGYGFDGGFVDGKIKIAGSNFSQWNDFSTLTTAQERTLRICNWNTPKPPVTVEAELTPLSQNPGEWSWSANYRVSVKGDTEFFSSWKVRVDVSELNRGYRGSSPLHSSPGAGDLKITQISANVYEVEGIGWPTTGIRNGHSVEFRLGR